PYYYQGTVAQGSNQSFDQGSPSSSDSRKGKMIKAEPSDGILAKSGEMTNFTAVPNNSQMENISNVSGNMKNENNA
ncbi:helicase swr1, partial [Trifolium medium]|nr:helicase swr1 [Trifolium medium]